VIAAIDVEALLQLAWVAPLTSIVVALSYSIFVLAVTRATDSRRGGATSAAVAYGMLAIVSALVFGAVVVAGVSIIVAK